MLKMNVQWWMDISETEGLNVAPETNWTIIQPNTTSWFIYLTKVSKPQLWKAIKVTFLITAPKSSSNI